jgi:hypothetical protein
MAHIKLVSAEHLAAVIYDAIMRHAVGAIGAFQEASVDGNQETRIDANIDLLAVAHNVIEQLEAGNG